MSCGTGCPDLLGRPVGEDVDRPAGYVQVGLLGCHATAAPERRLLSPDGGLDSLAGRRFVQLDPHGAEPVTEFHGQWLPIRRYLERWRDFEVHGALNFRPVLVHFDNRDQFGSRPVPAPPDVGGIRSRDREPVGARADLVGDGEAGEFERVHGLLPPP